MRCCLPKADIVSVVSTLAPLHKALDHRRIFLTGGTGFFGKWLLYSFVALRQAYDLDSTMTVLSRDPKRFFDSHPAFSRQPGVEFIAGDVRTFDFSPLPTFDFVIHGATSASAKLEHDHPDEMRSVIVDGTRHVIDFTRHCSVKRFLEISSGAVYGPQPSALSALPETYEGVPLTSYGKGKKIAEQLCLEAAADKFECVIVRPFAFVGPYLPLDTHFAIGNFIRDCLLGRPIVIQGDGTPVRSYLYAADLTDWLWTMLLLGQSGRSYNVGTSDAISIFDLAHRVRRCAGTQNEIIVREKPVEGAWPIRYVPSVERAERELGLVPR